VILWKSTIRHYRKHPWQILLSTIGITLGVAVVVAIDLTNSSAQKAFELSADALTGKATHQIIGVSSDIPEQLYLDMRKESELTAVAPVVEGYAKLLNLHQQQYDETSPIFQLIGIDIFAEKPFRNYFGFGQGKFDIAQLLQKSNTAIIAKSTADLHHVKLNDTMQFLIAGVEHKLKIVGFIGDDSQIQKLALSSILFVDIATAQELLHMQGLLSRIDLIIPDTREGKRKYQELKVSLPSNVDVVASNLRNNAMAQMTKAFETNLTALSFLALMVGMFLIYNTMTFAVVLRRQIIGALRALGVTRGEIFKMIFTESLLIGFFSTVMGILLGILLADGLLGLVTRTINDLYFVLNVQGLNISIFSLAKAIILGVCATAFSGFIPAYEATKSTPRTSLARSTLETKYKGAFAWSKWIGGGVILAGTMLLVVPHSYLWLSFIGMFCIILGFALYVPKLTLLLVNIAVPILHKILGTLGNISARSVSTSLSRTSIAVASLSVAIATTIGVSVMIDSFRGSVIDWLDNSLKADVFISTPGANSSRSKGNLSSVWVDRFKGIPEVRDVSVVRRVQLQAPKGITELNVLKISPPLFSMFDIKHGKYTVAQQGFFEEDGLLVSESYAYRHGINVGELLVLPTDKGLKSFKVVGIYVDYGSDQGVVTINRDTYNRYWNDRSITSIGLYTNPGININYFIDKLTKLVKNYQINSQGADKEQDIIIRSNLAIKEASISVFDRTFVVTEVLRLLAIFVAFVGIVSALMSIQFERRAEIALFRVLGLTPQEVWLVVSGETGLIGVIAGILSIPLGLILAVILIYVINRRSFGWSIDITLEPMLLLQSVLLAVTAAMIAGMIPAFKMSKSNPVSVLREE